MRELRKRRAVVCAISFALLCAPAIGAAEKDQEDTCETKILRLGKDVERIAWVIPGIWFTNFVAAILYRDGRTEKVEGNANGFCARDPNHKMGSNNWLTAEERGVAAEVFNFQPENNVNDTTGTGKPGPTDALAFWSFLMNRTSRYDHDVLGRGYHLTRLVASLNKSDSRRWIDLPPDRVFMERFPHKFFIDESGNRVPTVGYALVEGHVEHGPALSVYGYFKGRLQLLARTPWHGKKSGWVNLVAARDFDRDRCAEIALIRDPHENGTLELWELQYETAPSGTPFTLVLKAQAEGFSNHAFGTSAARISVVADVNFDRNFEIVVPDRTRKILRVMSLAGDRLTEIHRIELPSPVAHNMTFDWPFSYRPKQGYTLVVPLEDNTIRLLQLPNWKRQRTKRPPECAGAYRPG